MPAMNERAVVARSLAQLAECIPELSSEDLRLLPSREMAALVRPVVMNQMRVGALHPAFRRLIRVLAEHADRDWKRNLIGLPDRGQCRAPAVILPIEPARRRAAVGKPVQGNVVEHIVARRRMVIAKRPMSK